MDWLLYNLAINIVDTYNNGIVISNDFVKTVASHVIEVKLHLAEIYYLPHSLWKLHLCRIVGLVRSVEHDWTVIRILLDSNTSVYSADSRN